MRDALRLYARYVRASVCGQLQYRASFVMSAIGVFVVAASEALAVVALFDRFGQLRGWTLPEIALFYGMVSVSWAVCDALGRALDHLGDLIGSGDFDRLLLRPRSPIFQLIAQELTLRRAGRLVQGAILLGYAAGHVAWTAPRAALLAAAIAGSVCAFLGVLVLQATSTFWTITGLEVWNAFTYGGLTMSQYPLAIYRGWFRALFTFAIPIGCTVYFPGVAILGRPEPLGTPAVVGWLAPLAGPAFLAITLQIWRLGVRRYRSTGS
jgi:ABC-2 type transport system permease protein